jgi:hypothetical protein
MKYHKDFVQNDKRLFNLKNEVSFLPEMTRNVIRNEFFASKMVSSNHLADTRGIRVMMGGHLR